MGGLKTIAVIQARMGSTRLRGKMMMEIAGLPLIGHVILRLKQAKSIDKIILATSTNLEDDPLAEYAILQGINIIRGSAENVLSRFVEAAKTYPSDYIIRICGDAPLIDAPLIDQMMEAMEAQAGDLISVNYEGSFLQGGIEPISKKAFWRMVEEASDHPIAVEHVTGYLETFKPSWIKRATITPSLDYSIDKSVNGDKPIRLWVDSPLDLNFMEALYQQAGVPAGTLDHRRLKQLLLENSEILTINQHVRQKTAQEITKLIYIVVEAGSQIGMGHLKRMISLGNKLRDQYSYGIVFILGGDQTAPIALPFPIIRLADQAREAALIEIQSQKPASAMIFDLKEKTTDIAMLKDQFPKLVCVLIDDDSKRNLKADQSYLPPLSSLPKADKENSFFSGFEWMILPAVESSPIPFKPVKKGDLRVLITMGGSDPESYSLKILKQLEAIGNLQDIRFNFVIGQFMQGKDQFMAAVEKSSLGITIIEPQEDLSPWIDDSDLVICRYGVTAYEVIARHRSLIFLSGNEAENDAMRQFKQLSHAIDYQDNPDCLPAYLDPIKGEALRQALRNRAEKCFPFHVNQEKYISGTSRIASNINACIISD